MPFFVRMQLSYQAYPNLSRSWSTCWGLWLKINVSWNMLDNVRPTPHVRPPGGGSLSLLVRRIVATADWNAVAWSEKTMNKQQINGSRFRWRTKSLCLIDLNGEAFFNKCLPFVLQFLGPLFSSTCCQHSITHQNVVRCRFRLYLSGRWCTTRRPLLVWKSYQGAPGLFLLRSGDLGAPGLHIWYMQGEGEWLLQIKIRCSHRKTQ